MTVVYFTATVLASLALAYVLIDAAFRVIKWRVRRAD